MSKVNFDVKFFRPSELIFSKTAEIYSIDNCPRDFGQYFNVYLLAFYLSHVRRKLGKPIVINSGYRSPALNDAVGGVKYSKHLLGLAVDISILQFTDYGKIYDIVKDDCRFIKYYPDRHYLHVDFTQEFLYNFFKQNSYLYEI